MADISLFMKAKELGKSLEKLAPQVEGELQAAVQNLAFATHASMVAKIQSMRMNPKNRQDYLRGLHFKDLGNDNYLIYLDGEWANKLEDGFGPFNMKDTLLNSQKTVEVGSRAGQPWVQQNAQGKKYAAVPFEHKPYSGDAGSGDLGADIKKMTALNSAGKSQKLTKTFKDIDGNPIAGKVATVTETDNPNLKGLTKYQHVHASGRVSSVYMTFRYISENSDGWQHPGHSGYQIFKEAEEYVDAEMGNILKTILGD